MAALVESEEEPGPLLRAAVKQQLIPEALRDAPDWTRNIRIVDNIMVPSSDRDNQSIPLPECNLQLFIDCDTVQGEAVTQCLVLTTCIELVALGKKRKDYAARRDSRQAHGQPELPFVTQGASWACSVLYHKAAGRYV